MNAIQTAMLRVAKERMNEAEYAEAEKIAAAVDAGEAGAVEKLIEMADLVLHRVT